MQLEQKDKVIEQLKAQIELLESERDDKWRNYVKELEENKLKLAVKTRSVSRSMRKRQKRAKPSSINYLHKQIKQLQKDNIKLEVSVKYDTSFQQSVEELDIVKEQLKDKQELIEQFK